MELSLSLKLRCKLCEKEPFRMNPTKDEYQSLMLFGFKKYSRCPMCLANTEERMNKPWWRSRVDRHFDRMKFKTKS
jgi:hypothetical protein